MAPVSLFDDDDDEEEDDNNAKVTINKKFARDYEARKLRQELKEHQQQNGDGDSGDDFSSDEEEEDEAAVLLTTKLDTSILKTIHALRSKDERIYDPNAKFFPDEDEDASRNDQEQQKERDKPKYAKDVIREQILDDMEKEDINGDEETPPPSKFMYDETQEEARRAFLDAANDMNDEEEQEPVVVLKSSETSNPEDETEFIQELKKLETTKGTKDEFVDPKGEVKDGEAFLMNFFQQRPWKMEDDELSSEDSGEESVPMKKGGKENDSDEDSLEQLEDAETFEAEYNFRFEQAAQDMSGADQSLQTYSRVDAMSLRRPDDRRKAKRQERAERKAAERKAKEEQLKRLKNAKRKEMEEKLAQLKAVVGSSGDLDDEAVLKMLEGDFDPEQFENLMNETYNEDFYNKEDPEWKNDRDVQKSLDLEFIDNEDGDLYDDGNEYDEEDDQKLPADAANVEEEYDEDIWPEEEPEESELVQKVRAKMEDELYKLDYEDIVAGMPTRFKYRKVEPNNYGLSTEEILLARDTTLKQYVSLKKMAPYAETEYRANGVKRRKFRLLLKQDIEEQVKEIEDAQPKEVIKKKKRRLRKKEKREAANESNDIAKPVPEHEKEATGSKSNKPSVALQHTTGNSEKLETSKADIAGPPVKVSKTTPDEPPSDSRDKEEKKRKKKKRKRKNKVEGVSAARMEAYGL